MTDIDLSQHDSRGLLAYELGYTRQAIDDFLSGNRTRDQLVWSLDRIDQAVAARRAELDAS